MSRGEGLLMIFLLGFTLGIGVMRLIVDGAVGYFALTAIMNLLWLPGALRGAVKRTN